MLSGALGVSLGAGALFATQAHAAQAMDFSDLVAQVSPGVVRISIVKSVSEEEMARAQAVEMLRQYLGDRANLPDATPALEHAYGTGFFITKDGYILTNHHVIDGADRITVTLSDRTELDAVLVGSDEPSDIAVLKVAGENFPALTLNTADDVRVGEPVLAIGSPFGFDYSASAGIVSAKSRNVTREAAVPFIQSDVALNPGNSGGPLFNKNGDVVAVNSLIFSRTGGHMGLSFSIPIDAAMHIYEQIKAHGKVIRAYMGITVQDVDRNLAEVYGLDKPQGALLTRIAADSPAAKAGLKTGDVVLSFNGKPISMAADLLNLLNRAQPEDVFNMTVWRAGQSMNVQGGFTEAPRDVSAEQNQGDGVRLGLRMRELSASEQRTLASMGAAGGVLVTSVDPMGLAARAGIAAGDVLLGLNNHPTTNAQNVAAIIKTLPKQGVVPVQLIRQGTPAIIGLRIE
ncbi:serine protease [Moraxella caviae]|uniref:Probable periplasmic serine endoprotease DegP-like n=1 Tax=Moraxella caviae TaxID=34060 RepID=A0A1T0A7F5_9GAMM|nr:serine protease [Moraxella caviae]